MVIVSNNLFGLRMIIPAFEIRTGGLETVYETSNSQGKTATGSV